MAGIEPHNDIKRQKEKKNINESWLELKLMGDCSLGETGRVEMSGRSKKVTEIREMKKIPMSEALAEDRQNVMCAWAGRLELKGREIVYQLDRG